MHRNVNGFFEAGTDSIDEPEWKKKKEEGRDSVSSINNDQDMVKAGTWSMSLRVQFPSYRPSSSIVGTVSYNDDILNISGKKLSELGGVVEDTENPSSSTKSGVTAQDGITRGPEGSSDEAPDDAASLSDTRLGGPSGTPFNRIVSHTGHNSKQ